MNLVSDLWRGWARHKQAKLRDLQVGDFVNDMGAPRHTLQIVLALVDGGAQLPPVVPVNSQVGVDIRLVRQRAFDPRGPYDRIQPHHLVLVCEGLVVDADDVLAVGPRVARAHLRRHHLALEHGPGHALPGVVHLEAGVQVHQPLP